MFSDLKHHLNDIDETTWMAIPEVGDYKNKKQRSEHLAFVYDRITATPDTILLGNLSKSQKSTLRWKMEVFEKKDVKSAENCEKIAKKFEKKTVYKKS